MDMKYVVLRHRNGDEHLFICPPAVDHDRFAEAMQAIRFGSEQRWERHAYTDAVSAGFVSAEGACYGHSITLDLNSRGEADTALLRNPPGPKLAGGKRY